jgi:hypothetical protein
MYRQYEDPHKLTEQLATLMAEASLNPEDEELAIAIHELQERINFAWQDDEYEEEFIC